MGDYDWGQGGKGAAGGALAGFGVAGPIGAIGGGILGLLGGFGQGDTAAQAKQRQMLEDYYKQIGNRTPDQAGPAAQSGYSGFRNNQTDLVNRLEAMSKGQGPSLAAQQFQQATDRNNSSQMAMAASGRGGPLASFNAAGNMANLGAQAAQGSAIARTGEELGAMGQLGGVLQGARGADEENSRFNAGQTNQTALANLDARLRAMGMNDQARLQILAQMGGMNQQQAQMPGTGDQLMAGGAGLFSLMSTQRAQNRASQNGMPVSMNGMPNLVNPNQWGPNANPQEPSGDNPYGWTPNHG